MVSVVYHARFIVNAGTAVSKQAAGVPLGLEQAGVRSVRSTTRASESLRRESIVGKLRPRRNGPAKPGGRLTRYLCGYHNTAYLRRRCRTAKRPVRNRLARAAAYRTRGCSCFRNWKPGDKDWSRKRWCSAGAAMAIACHRAGATRRVPHEKDPAVSCPSRR